MHSFLSRDLRKDLEIMCLVFESLNHVFCLKLKAKSGQLLCTVMILVLNTHRDEIAVQILIRLSPILRITLVRFFTLQFDLEALL